MSIREAAASHGRICAPDGKVGRAMLSRAGRAASFSVLFVLWCA
ncbi:hypothetical protein [Sphingobacterium sp. N143]|nr:hypothetical protein [Sphingobacterium sp. N143]